MTWFGGCAPGPPATVPVGAQLIWSDPPLWTAGDMPAHRLRLHHGEKVRLAVIGTCTATQAELARMADSPDPGSLMSWPGSYIVVRRTASGAAEIITDVAGALPVYSAITPGGLRMWGSSSRALAGLNGVEVDVDWLASHLNKREEPLPGRSPWVGVTPVPPGHRMVLGPTGSVSVTRWWSPERRDPDVAASRLRHALIKGVRERATNTVISCDVAGLDSSTLAAIASRYAPLVGITAHPADIMTGGDMDYATSLNAQDLTHVALPLDDRHLPFTEPDIPLPATDEPAPSTAAWAKLSTQLLRVTETGSRCHLTGDGGDNLFLPPPTHLIDLVRDLRLVHLAKDVLGWSRLHKVSPWPVMRAALQADTDHLIRPRPARPAWLPEHAFDHHSTQGDGDSALITDIRYVARSAYADVQLAECVGVELHNPYLDGAVVDAVASSPPWTRFSAHRYKPLLVDAIGDFLPPHVRGRTTKGVFAGDFHRGVRANDKRLLELCDGRLADMGLIEPAPLRSVVRAAALGAQTPWPELLTALDAEMWLRAVEGAPASEWEHLTRSGARS